MRLNSVSIETADKTRRFVLEQKTCPQIRLRYSYPGHFIPCVWPDCRAEMGRLGGRVTKRHSLRLLEMTAPVGSSTPTHSWGTRLKVFLPQYLLVFALLSFLFLKLSHHSLASVENYFRWTISLGSAKSFSPTITFIANNLLLFTFPRCPAPPAVP